MSYYNGTPKVAPVPNDSNSYHLWLLYHLVPSQLDEGGSPPKAFGAETEQLACPDAFLRVTDQSWQQKTPQKNKCWDRMYNV